MKDEDGILWVKKGTIRDDTGSVPFVLWGLHAKTPVFEGDMLEIYNCRMKQPDKETRGNTTGEAEIHAGYNTCIRLPDGNNSVSASLTGVVEEFCDGVYLANEDGRYLLKGDIAWEDICGFEMAVSGILSGRILKADFVSPVLHDLNSLEGRLLVLEERYQKRFAGRK